MASVRSNIFLKRENRPRASARGQGSFHPQNHGTSQGFRRRRRKHDCRHVLMNRRRRHSSLACTFCPVNRVFVDKWLPGLPRASVRRSLSGKKAVSHVCRTLRHRPGCVHQVQVLVYRGLPVSRHLHQERPCEKACGVGATHPDKYGRAEIDQNKCVACGMRLVSCPLRGNRGQESDFPDDQGNPERHARLRHRRLLRLPPASSGKTSHRRESVPRSKHFGFTDVAEVAVGADLCTIEEAKDFLREVPDTNCASWHKLLPCLGHDG